MLNFLILVLVYSFNALATSPRSSLKDFSNKMNKSLPEVYDHATKLVSTSVHNQDFKYHFILNATQEEFLQALPKVKQEILKTICIKAREKSILKDYKANIIYSYESVKGQSLGEFMVKPEYCSR